MPSRELISECREVSNAIMFCLLGDDNKNLKLSRLSDSCRYDDNSHSKGRLNEFHAVT